MNGNEKETTLRHRTANAARWKQLMLAATLALGLLLLTLVDSARTIGNAGLMASLLVLLAVLALMAVRLWLQTRTPGTAAPRATSVESPPAATARLILLALTLLAAALRLYDLGRESLWVDEVWTVTWAAQPLRSVLQNANPLAYVIAHVTLPISRSEFALRLAPALAGVALVPATYLLGRALYGRKEGLLAAALLSVSVYAIEHSQEVRFYAWQMLFSTLTLYFLLRGLEHGRRRDWAGLALTTALNLYNHPFAFFVLASEGLYTVWFVATSSLRAEEGVPFSQKLRACVRRLLPPAAAAGVALVAFLPMLSLLFSFNNTLWVAGSGRAQHLPLGMDNVSWTAWPFAFGTYGMLAEYLDLRSIPFLVYPVLAVFNLGLLSVRRRAAVVVLWFLVPLPILLLTRYWLQPRYLGYFLPLFLVVTAAGVTWLAAAMAPRRRPGAAALIALTGLLALPSLAQLPGYYAAPQEDQWREVTAFVESNYRPGDLVLVTSAYDPTPLPFDWYATVPANELPRQVFPREPEKGVLIRREQLDLLPATTRGHARVWFVYCYVGRENQALIVEAMQKTHGLVEEWHYVGLDVMLFEEF